MSFQSLSGDEKLQMQTLELACDTRDRAHLSRHLAETRLHFLELARPLLDGDPWLLTEPEIVQAAYRAHHAEASGIEYNRLTDALLWLRETTDLIDALVGNQGDE